MKYLSNLRIIREKKGYSQEYMAYVIGISYGTYHNIEKGKSNIKMSILIQCAEILEVHLFELLHEKHSHVFLKKIENLENQLEEKNKIISFLLKK